MHIVQQSLAPVQNSKLALYKDTGSDGAPVAGYNVCYELSEAVTPGANEFAEDVLGRVVAKPKTANLAAYAGVVKNVIHQISTTTWLVEIITPTRGEHVDAYTNADCDPGPTVLQCANDNWALVAQTLTSNQIQTGTVAISAEVGDTSGTAANLLVRFV